MENFEENEAVEMQDQKGEEPSQSVSESVPVEIENPAEAEESPENSKKTSEKKRKNPVLRFFRIVFTILCVLVLILLGVFVFCAVDKKSSLSAIPRNYSVYVRTASAFDTLNPLFDLQAADVFLSSSEFSSIRKPFMDFRSSSLRENPLVTFASSRPVDFALYGHGSNLGVDSHFVAVLDLGGFSFLSRLVFYLYPKLNLQYEFTQNLSYEQNEQTSYYVYKTPSLTLYLKSVKNLVIVSDSFEHLLAASLVQNDTSYTKEQLSLFKAKKSGELKIVADAHSLMHFVTEGNEILASMVNIVSSDALSVISFNISDSDVAVKCQIPISSEPEDAHSLSPLLSKKSTVPTILPRFSDVVQYYTILNAGSLEELKNAVLPFVSDVKNPDEFWKNCDDWSKSLLNMDLNEFLFSWTGTEVAVFGVENQNDPVFALQIKDEKQRQKAFNKPTDSILIKDDNSLILDGVRLPQLKFPAFLNWMLSVLGINLPSPYFMVLDGNIYFSESAECLSSVYTNAHSGKALVKNKNYTDVSKGLKNESTISLFYNLERSVPFFLRSNEAFSKVLKLYTMGRFDMRLEKDLIELNLHACARKSGSLYSVPGFPMALEGKADSSNLQVDSGKNPQHVYWVEDGKNIKAFEVSGMALSSKSDSDKIAIAAAEKPKNGGVLWSVSSHGIVSLLNANLENVGKFPLMLGEPVSVRPCAVNENLVVISEKGSVFIVKPDASVVTIEIPSLSAKSEAVSLGNSFAIYSKGFLGQIYYFEGDKCLNLEEPIEIPGIAFGKPALMKANGKICIGFITQAGEMNVWRSDSKDGSQLDGFPMRLGGIFMTNVVASEKYFYALSNDALLYRISLEGSVLTVQIPNSTAKEGYLCLRDSEHNGKMSVFVCADANVIYGFNESLELLSGYPLTGFGKPVFADVNGDKVGECIAITIDRKLVAWKTR